MNGQLTKPVDKDLQCLTVRLGVIQAQQLFQQQGQVIVRLGQKEGGNDVVDLRQPLFAIGVLGNDQMLEVQAILSQINRGFDYLVDIIRGRPLVIAIIQH